MSLHIDPLQVSDFGGSKVLTFDGQSPLPTTVPSPHNENRPRVGTPLYVAPEIWRNMTKGSKAADVYSFGVIIWELVHGRTAWDQYLEETNYQPKKINDYANMMAFRLTFPELLSSSMPAALICLGQQCLDDDPWGRPDFDKIFDALSVMDAGLTLLSVNEDFI